jgi:hypothetical protein
MFPTTQYNIITQKSVDTKQDECVFSPDILPPPERTNLVFWLHHITVIDANKSKR